MPMTLQQANFILTYWKSDKAQIFNQKELFKQRKSKTPAQKLKVNILNYWFSEGIKTDINLLYAWKTSPFICIS